VSEEKSLQIVELRAENTLRLKAVRIRPNGSMVLVGGRNAQGKSSVLNSIQMALGGGKAIPLEPVRHGARKATQRLDLGELVVERTITAKGTELVVTNRDGEIQRSPQSLLKALYSETSFDPVEFTRAEPKKQDEVLKKALGLDFSDLDAATAKLYDQRTGHNREVKRLEALIDSMPRHADAPTEPVNVEETAAELKRRNSLNAGRAAAEERISAERRALARWDERLAKMAKELEEARQNLENAQHEREELHAEILVLERNLPEAEPTEELEEKIAGAETVNGKLRANAERAKLEKELEAKLSAAEEATETMKSLADERAKRLAAAKFPIAGLGFDDSGPTLNDVPLAQASQAEKLRVSVAIAAALNPRLKVVLIRDGSVLDEDNLRLLAELAEAAGLQCWVERVGGKDPGAVIIEDGEVVEPAGAETTAAE
jgi:chromosome segregation ATPase